MDRGQCINILQNVQQKLQNRNKNVKSTSSRTNTIERVLTFKQTRRLVLQFKHLGQVFESQQDRCYIQLVSNTEKQVAENART